MSIVEDEREIRSLRRYIELYEGDPYVADDVAQARAELAGRLRRLAWLRARLGSSEQN